MPDSSDNITHEVCSSAQPAPVASPRVTASVRVAHLAGPALDRAFRGLLTRRFSPHLVRSTGFVLPTAGTAATRAVLADFARHDWGWYMHMARVAGHHRAIDPSTITVPATLVGARLDVLTDWRALRRVARAMPDARFRLVHTAGHFLPLEQPQIVLDELDLLATRAL